MALSAALPERMAAITPKTVDTTKASTTEIIAMTMVFMKACSTSPATGALLAIDSPRLPASTLPSQMKYWTGRG